MANAFLTGFSGLSTHQKLIEVVGHNLANLNTTAFKVRRASFADVFYETVKGGSGGAAGVAGGSNPAQIGNGSKLSSIGVNFSQGNLESTGGQFDFAIDGEGFFVVSTPEGPRYTRAGTFSVDANGYLVDAATGSHVQRFGTVGNAAPAGLTFQTPGSNSIQMPLGAVVPGVATSKATLRGNLSPSSDVSSLHQFASSTAWTVGGGAAVETDLVNDLDFVLTPYGAGDSIRLTGTDSLGAPLSAAINVDATTTIQELLDGIESQIPNTSARLESGVLIIEATTFGPSSLDFQMADAVGNVGSADFVTIPLGVAGSEGDVIRGGIEVFDEQGSPHVIGIEMHKQTDGTWRLDASIDSAEGTIVDGVVDGITFGVDGRLQVAGTTGIGDASLAVQFAGATSPQQIAIDFGTPNSLSGVTSIEGESSLASEQDGYSTGTIVAFNVGDGGVVQGVTNDGRRFDVAQIAVAQFRNPQGLESQGDNFYQATTSSGSVEIGAAQTGGRGALRSGQLELSNVDIASQFTQLIIAQRGFSANARTITVADEVLEELTNLLR